MQLGLKKPNRTLTGKPAIFARWAVTIASLSILASIGIYMNHQPLNAGGMKPVSPELTRPAPVQEVKITAKNPDNLANTPSIWPVSGAVTSSFGWRNSPWENSSELHQGIDIAANMGIPVVATADGTVTKSGWSGGYGNIVQIDHGNGIETIYGHNSQVLVTVGDKVKKGQFIAHAGSTGRSTGPHVHYEIRVNGSAVDPFKYLVQY